MAFDKIMPDTPVTYDEAIFAVDEAIAQLESIKQKIRRHPQQMSNEELKENFGSLLVGSLVYALESKPNPVLAAIRVLEIEVKRRQEEGKL